MDQLFELFLREKHFLSNVSARTIKYFKWCYSSFKKSNPDLNKQSLNVWVISLRESGITISTINSYIRGINSFLSWMHQNEHIKEPLKIKLLKEPQKTLKVFSDQQLKALLSYRPKKYSEHRLYALLCLIIDTGIRIEEGLTLTRNRIDLDNLLVTVRGKGNKERIVPISMECRKQLFRFLKMHNFDLVFPTRTGGRMTYRNSVRDFKNLCSNLGINGIRTSWHTLRHGFALNHVRQGGDVFSLQRMLGHSSLEVTKRYVNLTEDDLKLVHKKTSILSRLK
jgi:integrase/recombinase XerD